MSVTKDTVNSIELNDIQTLLKWKNSKIIAYETEVNELRKQKEWINAQLEQMRVKCDSYVETIVVQQKSIKLFESFSEEYSRIKSHNKGLDEVIMEMHKKYENDVKLLKENYRKQLECQNNEHSIELNKIRNDSIEINNRYESDMENLRRDFDKCKENAEQMIKQNNDLWKQKMFCERKGYEMKIESLNCSKMQIETQLNDAICQCEGLKVILKKFTKNESLNSNANTKDTTNKGKKRVTIVEPIKTMDLHKSLVKTQLESKGAKVVKPQPSMLKRKKLSPIDNSYFNYLRELSKKD